MNDDEPESEWVLPPKWSLTLMGWMAREMRPARVLEAMDSMAQDAEDWANGSYGA